MFSEPTISPNFVVRQKRKLIRHPLVIGGILCIILLGMGGIIPLLIPKTAPSNEPEVRITFESRIIFGTTPRLEATQEPTIIIQAPVIDTSDPFRNEENTASSQMASVQPRCKITTTGDTNVNIRSGPDISFSLISSLNDRQSVDVISSSDNRWFQILNIDGTIGWVGGSVVDETGDCGDLPQIQTPACSVENTTGNRVNIRNNASTNSNIIRTLASSDLLMADGRTAEGWYRILLTGRMGWIYRDVVALSDACSTVPIISANEPIPQPAMSQTSVVFNDGDCVVESFTGTAIDLRKGPGMEFPVMAKMNKAMIANRLSSNGWYEIAEFGWAFAGDLIYGGLCNLLPTITPDEIRGSSVILTGG